MGSKRGSEAAQIASPTQFLLVPPALWLGRSRKPDCVLSKIRYPTLVAERQ